MNLAPLNGEEGRVLAMAVDEGRFREIFAALPTTVAIVTVTDGFGQPRGLTSNTICAVSQTPPLLLVCVDNRSRTLPALRESRAFVVNFLVDGRGWLSRQFAGKGANKFAAVSWWPSSHAAGAPILADDTLAYAECVVVEESDGSRVARSAVALR